MSNSKPNQPNQNEHEFRKLATTYYTPTAAQNAAMPAKETQESTAKRRFSWKKALAALLLSITIPLAVLIVWNIHNFSNASSQLFGTSSPLGLLQPADLKSDSSNRVNVLIVGYSADNPNHGGATLTDSILILSLNKKDSSGYMLSVPRDLYVDITHHGYAKINEAYQNGERIDFSEPGYFSGGIGLLQKTIADNLGVELHYYALIDYATVRDTVDALGGVTVRIDSPDERGLYDPNFRPEEGGPLKLSNGPQKVDGQTALRLTRARGATNGSYGFPRSDFNRTENQQKVFSAIKEELTWTLLLNPRKNGAIFSSAGENVETNLMISELIPLYRLFNNVPTESLDSISLSQINDSVLLTGYTTSNGQSALIPAAGIDDFTQIQTSINSLDR